MVLAALLIWWLVYLGAAWYLVAVTVGFAECVVGLWTMGQLSSPTVTMDRDGLRDHATWVRLAWHDVVNISAYRQPDGVATLILHLADPDRVAGEAGGHRRGRKAARTIVQIGGLEVAVNDRNMSAEAIIGLIRTAVAEAPSPQTADRPR